jgi:virulence-associated protein VapD
LKKLSAFLTVFLLALTGVSYLYYTQWRSEQQTKGMFPYIPQSAALVYEVANFDKQWRHFQKTPLAKTLDQIPAFVAIQQSLDGLKGLLDVSQSLDEVPLIISVHGLSEEHLGYIFYFNTHNTATKRCVEAIMAKAKQDTAYNTTVRNYAGYKLTEVSKHGAPQPLFYTKHDQYMIASYSSLLIEDVVRGLANKQTTGLTGLKKTDNAQGSLYVNFAQLPQLLRTFVKHGQADSLSTALATLTRASHLNLTLTPHHLLLRGFSKDEGKTPSYLTHTLHGQTAGSMLLAPYLPQDTAMLQHFTFSDVEHSFAAFQQYRSWPQASEISETRDSSPLTSALYPLLQGEIGLCTLATKHTQKEDRLVFIKVKDPQLFIEVLKASHLITSLSSQRLHLPSSTYRLTTGCFQHWLPKHLFPAFEANYLTRIDDHIVLANSQVGLQTWYTQYQQGKTWEKTPQQDEWLESILDQAQFSLFIDLQKVWPQVIRVLKPTWQQVFKTHADAFQKFRYVSLQLLHEQDIGCYMSILLNHQDKSCSQVSQARQEPATRQDTSQKVLAASTVFQTDSSIINRPWLVASHRGKGHYVLLQDTLHQLYFLDPAGKLLWKKTLEGAITTDLIEIDYYKNNKTQYLFATNKQVHLIDYHGHEIIRYPHPLHQPGQSIRLRLVDYNHNKDYRFLIATVQGNIYLKDKHYRPLHAWNPRALGQDFAGTPFHIRVQEKDYFLALQTNGTLQALNRKGQTCPGFPVDLKAVIQNPLSVHKGKTVDDTTLVALTDTGQHICLNLAGHIQETVQLDRSEDTYRFIVCPNRVERHEYVIIRHDADKVVVMDEAKNLLCELRHQAQHLLLQYYNFGNNNRFYVLTNTDEQLTYLYDHTGNLLHDTPWHNEHEVSLLFSESEKQLQVYVGFERLLFQYTLHTSGG